MKIQGLRRPDTHWLHLSLYDGHRQHELALLLNKPLAGCHLILDAPLKGQQPHGSQGPLRSQVLNRRIQGLRKAPGLWELALDDDSVLALNWRRRQAGIRLRQRSVLAGDWLDYLPLQPACSAEDLQAERRRLETESWRRREAKRIQRQIALLETTDSEDPQILREQAQRLSALRRDVVEKKTHFLLPHYDGSQAPELLSRVAGESLQQRVDRLFKDSGRTARRREANEERLRTLRQKLEGLPEQEPEESGPSSPQKPRGEKGLGPGIRCFRLESGRQVFVGKDAKANHRLTFRVGRGRDLWFHRRNGPGPHVLLRRDKNEEVPQAEIKLAAALALNFGPRGTGRCEEVRWTERRFLSPVPGAPGTVLMGREKVILVDLDEQGDALRRLLSR